MAPVLIDIEKVCRLCLREDDGHSKMTSIYERQDLEETIYKCVQIEVNILTFLTFAVLEKHCFLLILLKFLN